MCLDIIWSPVQLEGCCCWFFFANCVPPISFCLLSSMPPWIVLQIYHGAFTNGIFFSGYLWILTNVKNIKKIKMMGQLVFFLLWYSCNILFRCRTDYCWDNYVHFKWQSQWDLCWFWRFLYYRKYGIRPPSRSSSTLCPFFYCHSRSF